MKKCLRSIALVVDGKDFHAQTVRNNRTISTVQQGNKLKEASIRILTWSLPFGLNVEHTNGFFARATEKNINFVWCRYGRLIIPVGYIVSGDKGFFGTSGFYVNFNPILSPSFLYGNSQFSPQQMNHNLRSCQLRYTCEVVYSNVTNCIRLEGFFPRNLFHHFQDLCDWAHGRANMYLPLQMPAKNSDFFPKFQDMLTMNQEREIEKTKSFKCLCLL